MIVIPGPNGVIIAEKLAKRMDWRFIIPEYKYYNDGESTFRIKESLNEDAIIIQSCGYPQDSNLFQLLNIISTIRAKSECEITAFVPYLCYARADREVLGGEAISSRTVIQLLERSGLNHLITVDVHNPSIFEFADMMKTTNIYPSHAWANYIKKNFTDLESFQIVAPDRGALNRAKVLATELGVSYTSLDKIRNPETGNVSLNSGSTIIESEVVILVDDIMSTGSTLVEASSLLKTMGVHTIHILLSHAISTDAVDKLTEIGSGIVKATESIPNLIGTLSLLDDLVSVVEQ